MRAAADAAGAAGCEPRREGGTTMTSVTHGSAPLRARPQWAEFLRIREMWASLAIMTMWLAVLFDAVYGPDFVSTNGSGLQTTTIPSAIVVALFAFLGTASIAKHALSHD
jgi:hypothetical protein